MQGWVVTLPTGEIQCERNFCCCAACSCQLRPALHWRSRLPLLPRQCRVNGRPPRRQLRRRQGGGASKLVGLNVYNTANEKIGDISEILLDTSGKVSGVIIGVGGFLGLGQHDVLVQMEQLKFVNEPRPSTPTTTTTAPTSTTTPPTAGTTTARSANEKWYPDHATMNATKDQLKGMPAFKYN